MDTSSPQVGLALNFYLYIDKVMFVYHSSGIYKSIRRFFKNFPFVASFHKAHFLMFSKYDGAGGFLLQRSPQFHMSITTLKHGTTPS